MLRRSRITFNWFAALLMLVVAAPVAAAQEATPAGGAVASPAGVGETVSSVSREQYYQQLREAFAFEEPASRGGQLIVGESTDIQTVNGILTTDVYSAWVNGLMFEALVGSSPVDGSIIPGLADSYELAADGITYTFRLNPNATWHDGTDLTSADVVFSFDFALSPDSLYTYQSQVDQQVASYRTIDDDTVEIVAEGVSATFLYDAPGTVSIMPRHIWESVPFANWQNDPGSTGQDPARVIGSGPFRFQEWQQGNSVTLVRNDAYWDPEAIPVIDEFVYRVLPDDNTAIQALTTGEIDINQDIPPAQLETLQNTEGVEVTIYDTLRFNWFATNQTLPIFQQREVRQAMLYALDRQLIVDEIYLGLAEPANGTQPVLSPSYAPDQIETVYDFNPDLARQLLEEAGWTDSDEDGTVDQDLNGDGSISDDEQLRFDFIYSEGVAIYEQQVPYMQQAWDEVGIDMLPQAVPFPTLSDRVETADFGVALFGFSWSPDGGQGLMYRCDAFEPEGFNAMRYCNPEYDALDAEQSQTLDDEARRQLQIDASNVINTDAANGIIVFRQEPTGYGSRVHNFFPTGWGSSAFIATIPFVWVDPQ